jgi:enolase
MLPNVSRISAIDSREVLDSRGDPTIEVDVHCGAGVRGRAIVPSGASTGRHEAIELRDADAARFGGKGVLKAVANVCNAIAPSLIGHDVADQFGIDRLLLQLDGTPNKSRLGANAILGVSLSCAHAAARANSEPLFARLASLWQDRVLDFERRFTDTLTDPAVKNQKSKIKKSISLPLPMVNMISGGRHAGGKLDFQDFLAVPVGAASFAEAVHRVVQVYRALRWVLATRGLESALVGDEGGFGPKLAENGEAVELIVEAISAAGLEPGRDMAIAVDVASSQFFRDGRYRTAATSANEWTAADMVDELDTWVRRYPIVSIEDGCAEDDWDGWRLLTDRLGDRVQLIGDDLFATNPARLSQGIDKRVANAILVKPNQIGTLTETLDVLALARSAGYRTIVSARSGETEDTTIAHLAVATAAGQIKIGSIARSERLAKYNELLRIEEALGRRAEFSGNACRA